MSGTGPIKPPSQKPIGSTPADLARPTAETGASFREDLLTTPDIPSRRGADGVSTDPVLDAIAEDVRAGRLSATAAVDALVERALASPMARGLSAEARARLEETLRAQLADDPGLAGLVADLRRSK